jgi:hypothetical protein
MATKHETYLLDVEVGFYNEWVPSHIEEGHGYHEMGNYNSLELGTIVIKLANGNEIDITAQLNEETRKAILTEIAEDL